MSVLGLDIGNANSLIAVVQRGGVDLIANEASKLNNPTMVGFGEKQRFEGEAALAQQSANLKNTISNLKLLIGRNWNDQTLHSELKNLGLQNNFTEGPNGGINVSVNFRNETRSFTIEQIYSGFLSKLKMITERSQKVKVKDVVISVPRYYRDQQRRAVKNAATIAGFNVLRLINDNLATSIHYGLYKIDLPEKEPRKIMIFDSGNLGFTASVVTFTKSQVEVLSAVEKIGCGGSGVDLLLANYFADQYFKKFNVDLRNYPKSWYRLLTSVEKVKKILNQNPLAPVNVECIYEDKDISDVLSREKYEEILQPILQSIPVVLGECLDRAKVKASELQSVELVGSTSRIYAIQREICSFLGKDLSFTMNAEEAVAKGASLACAMLSPLIKVRPYDLIDVVSHPIEAIWGAEGKAWGSVVLYPAGSQLKGSVNKYGAKYLNLNVRPGFSKVDLKFKYTDSDEFISIAQISLNPDHDTSKACKIRVRVQLDHSGILSVDSAELETVIEVVEPLAKEVKEPSVSTNGTESGAPDEKNDENSNNNCTNTAPDATANTNANEDNSKNPAAAEGATPDDSNSNNKEEPEKKIRKTYSSIPMRVEYNHEMKPETLVEFAKIESQIIADSLEAIAISEAKNAVEAYIYDMRAHLDDTWKDFLKSGEREQLVDALEKCSTWLEDNEYEDLAKTEYEDKLRHLHTFGDSIVSRVYEYKNLPNAVKRIQETLQSYRDRLASPETAHIVSEEKNKVIEELNINQKYLDSHLAKQNLLTQTDDSILSTRDLLERVQRIKDFSDPILNKPKPETPRPAEKASPRSDEGDSNTADSQMETETDKKSQEQDSKSQKMEQSEEPSPEVMEGPPLQNPCQESKKMEVD